MRGILVENGYYDSPAARHRAERLIAESEKLGVTLVVVKNNRPYTGRELPEEMRNADFALFFDKDLKLAYALENAGIPLFNPARGIEIVDDKALTAVMLDGANLPTPTTIPAPKRFDGGVDEGFLHAVGNRLGFPLVLKEDCGSLGEQVYLVKNFEELLVVDKRLSDKDRLYQSYEEKSRGESYRVIVVGKKTFCAVRLKNEGDFRSNAARGGVAEEAILSNEYRVLAEKVAELFDLDYCGVDLFCDRPSVIEVNSNAYFLTAEAVSKKNVARAIIERAIELKKGV